MTENSPPPIKMVQTANKGRSLFSSRPLKAGETILTDSPLLLYSAVPLGAAASAYCSHCFKTLPPTPLPCPQCGAVSLFCAPHCLSSALSTSHTPLVCRALSRLAAADSPLLPQPPDRHALARFLISAYNLAVASPPRFRALLELHGEPFVDETASFLHSVVSSVFRGEEGVGGLSLEMTAALLAKDRVNSFGLMDPFREGGERSVRAYGIYAVAAFFNHDCLPNACRFDYVDAGSADIVVRVLHDLPAGREVCLSYFPVNLRYKERQQRLKEYYGFVCECGRCEVEAKWSDNEEEEGDDEMDNEDNDMVGDEEGGDDDEAETTMDCGVDEEDDDFPHQYFFVKFMCSRENCGGTLAPLPPVDARPSTVMECNVCGNLSNAEE